MALTRLPKRDYFARCKSRKSNDKARESKSVNRQNFGRVGEQAVAAQRYCVRPKEPTCCAFQLLPHKLEADVLVDQPQQMVFRNVVFQAESFCEPARVRNVVTPPYTSENSFA